MHLETTSSGEGRILNLSGELTIAHAEVLREALRESLQGASHVMVRLAEVSTVDLSFLQLICSAHRTGAALGKPVSFDGPVPPLVRKVMKFAGFNRQKGCSFSPDSNCLGCGGE